MKNSLDQKFEALIKQLKSQQFDGRLTNSTPGHHLSFVELIKTAEELKVYDESLSRQREELLFAYQTLEAGYQRYWEFFNFAPDGYLVTDTEGVIQEANQTILSMLSANQVDLFGKPITLLIPELNKYDFGMQLNWFTGSQHLEVYLQSWNNTPLYVSVSIAPQCNIQNKTIGLLWLIRDIGERKKMEEALQKSKAELSLLLEQTPYLLWTTDIEFKLASIAGANLSNSGTSSSDIIGLNVADYFNTKPDNSIIKAHQNALTGLTQVIDFEWHGRIFQSTIEALKDTTERTIGVIGAAFDITDRKQAEKVLQKSEKFNSSLLQHSPNPIYVINSDTTISYVNPAFEKLTGFPARLVIGCKAPYPWWIESDNKKAMESFHKTLSKKKFKQEQLFHKKNGDEFWVESTTILIENPDDNNYFLQTWVDITEFKQLRKNMEFYIMQITTAQEEERKRIAQELHEETLQSLAALCLATESIINLKEHNSPKMVPNLKELRNKINGVIEEVRRFSYELRPGVLDYLGLIAALETLTDELIEKGIKANLTIVGKERTLPPNMEITIFRIVQEALSNVKKYSQANQVNVEVRYTPSQIKLKIHDNGQGFNLPIRLSELANEGKLGLIGIEERTRLFGGTFSIQTQLNRGTKINITLPLSVDLEVLP